MSEMPRPVRVWAEWDAWLMLVNQEMVPGGYARYHWPKGAEGQPDGPYMCASIERAIQIPAFGPLRSLRILLSGHDGSLRLYRNRERTLSPTQNAYESAFIPPGSWCWYLFDRCGTRATAGWFPPDTTDTDAVSRALAEAAAWVEQEGQEVSK